MKRDIVKISLIHYIQPRGKFTQEQIISLAKTLENTGQIENVGLKKCRVPYNYDLIYGELVFLALKSLNNEAIFANVYENDEEVDITSLFIQNNFKKFTHWFELVNFEKDLHEKLIAEKGQRKSGTRRKNDLWSLSDTAKLLNISIGTLSQDIALAKYLEDRPHLKKYDKTTVLLIKKNNK
jgi:hypothetical protein